MQGVRAHPSLAFLFRWSNLSGLWIPENAAAAKKQKWPRATEAVSLAVTVAAFGCSMYFLLQDVRDFRRVVSLSPSIVIFLLYTVVLAKSAYLWLRKAQILDLFRAMDQIVSFPPFAPHQKQVVDFVCANVRKTTLYLIFFSVTFMAVMLSTFLSFSLAHPERRAWHREIGFAVQTILSGDVDLWQKIWHACVLTALLTHFVLTFVLQVRNLLMDALMILCHYFVVQQLHLLNRLFRHPHTAFNHFPQFKGNDKKIFLHTSQFNSNNFDDWVVSFNKVKRLQSEVNNMFGVYCIILVSCAMTTLCFVAFTAAKEISASFIASYSMIAVVLVMQVFSCCKSGQNVKGAADKLTDTVCTGPWQDHALAESLHLIAVDLQRSFIVRGGPFFNLNLEFFASMIGAVFTYFVVLVQIKE